MKNILVTGGAGYIGSHTCKVLAKAGYKPVTFDNLSTGHRHTVKWGPLEVGDVRDTEKISTVLKQYKPEAVIHFASKIVVSESANFPDEYYDNNVNGTLSLLNAMKMHPVNAIVFSSTAAVYGYPEITPIDESHSLNPINPYGKTKLACEWLLQDFQAAYDINYVVLRYFNAAGADVKGELGEEHEPETHLIPLILKAVKNETSVSIFGDDYETPDGTCIRDYIHVADLADAHIKAMEYLFKNKQSGVFNLGTGKGYSVRQILNMAEEIALKNISEIQCERRLGDPDILVAKSDLAQQTLDWQPEFSDIKNIIKTAWQWHKQEYISSVDDEA
jgi:UDP-glucose-4-epimerase GalE